MAGKACSTLWLCYVVSSVAFFCHLEIIVQFISDARVHLKDITFGVCVFWCVCAFFSFVLCTCMFLPARACSCTHVYVCACVRAIVNDVVLLRTLSKQDSFVCLYVCLFVLRTYTALETLTEPHQIMTVLPCLVAVSKPLLTGGRSRMSDFKSRFPEGPSHLLPVVHDLLPGIDPNDFSKTIVRMLIGFVLIGRVFIIW